MNSKKIISIVALVIIIGGSFTILKLIGKKNNVDLTSTWQSTQTNQILTFKKDGTVDLVGNVPNGVYTIIKPNQMEYTVDGKTFVMSYEIKDGMLYWGLNKDKLESFKWISD